MTKQEFAPGDDELEAYRNGEAWDPEAAKALAEQKVNNSGCGIILLLLRIQMLSFHIYQKKTA